MTFKKGTSGNLAGRPPGKNVKLELWNKIVMPVREDIARLMVQLAMGGNEKMLIFIGERLFPRINDLNMTFQLPENINEENLFKLGEDIIRLVGDGSMTPEQGQILTATVKSHRDSLLMKSMMEQIKMLTEKVEKLEK